MINDLRHREIFNWQDYKHIPFHVIGLGAIGSRVYMHLIELGIPPSQINLYDFDRVESHNLANQAFIANDIGQYKVDAALARAHAKVPPTSESPPVTLHYEALPNDSTPTLRGVVFLMVDKIEARRQIVEHYCSPDRSSRPLLIVDGRMASTHGNVYTTTSTQAAVSDYLNTLPADGDNPETSELSACGTTMTVGTTAALIAALSVVQAMHYLKETGLETRKTSLFTVPLILTTN